MAEWWFYKIQEDRFSEAIKGKIYNFNSDSFLKHLESDGYNSNEIQNIKDISIRISDGAINYEKLTKSELKALNDLLLIILNDDEVSSVVGVCPMSPVGGLYFPLIDEYIVRLENSGKKNNLSNILIRGRQFGSQNTRASHIILNKGECEKIIQEYKSIESVNLPWTQSWCEETIISEMVSPLSSVSDGEILIGITDEKPTRSKSVKKHVEGTLKEPIPVKLDEKGRVSCPNCGFIFNPSTPNSRFWDGQKHIQCGQRIIINE